MRHWLVVLAALGACACAERSPEAGMFVRLDEPHSKGDPSPLFLTDALSRLTPDERKLYDGAGKVGGFLFTGEKYTCIVVVSFRTEPIINDGPAPAFCYDKDTNTFVQRL